MSRFESWQDVMDDTCERLRIQGDLTENFQRLKTNNDRILFCVRQALTKSRIKEWLQVLCSSKHKKYWEKAFELRSEGNMCFGAGKYRDAAEFYTRSILCAPFPENCSSINEGHKDELSMSYANRSAAWFYLEKYSLALRDIEQAMLHNYPNNLRYKLYVRQAQCQLKQGEYSFAIESLVTAEKALDLAEIHDAKLEKQMSEILSLREKCTSKHLVTKKEDDDDDGEEEVVIPSPNAQIANASSSLDVVYSTEKGRFVVANKAIKAGDSLFVERPYASVLLPSFEKSHCHHCYKRIKAVHPCRQCTQVRFCTANCSEESWNRYHRYECGYLDLLTSIGIAHLAGRVILTTGLPLLEDFMRSRNTLDCSYLSIYQLVTHEEQMHSEDLFQYSFTAALLLQFLDEQTSFFTLSSLSDRYQNLQLESTNRSQQWGQMRSECSMELKLFVGGLLLKHIQQLICNAHAISTIQDAEDEIVEEDGIILEQEQVRVATALFASASLMNHSCNPNIISGFRHGSTLVVKAVRDISAGEEVLNCYGPHYRRMAFQERQRALEEQYFFTCKCIACEQGDKEDQILMAMRCEYCEGPLGSVASSGRAECIQCKTTQDCLDKEQKAFRMHDLFVQGVQLADIGNYEESLDRLQRCLATREKLLYRHNKQLMETRDMVAKCLCAMSRFKDAATTLKLAVDSVRHIYGKNSIELGHELLKFGDVLLSATQESFERTGFSRELATLIGDTKRVLLLAEPIYLMHYGRSHPAIAELSEKAKKLEVFIARFKKSDGKHAD